MIEGHFFCIIIPHFGVHDLLEVIVLNIHNLRLHTLAAENPNFRIAANDQWSSG